MRIRLLVVFFIAFVLFLPHVDTAYGIDNPFSSFNNKFGIHILFPSELASAASLVNSSGGDWGYVTIPIQAGDKDIVKWQQFMDSAKKLHIIPIMRLATEGDYFNTKVWRKPNETDILDFANFLNSLEWPVKNRYIIVFNEVNRGDEWGGDVDPREYAELLAYTTTIFKSKSLDFFIISAGLDNAAPEASPQFKNEYNYLREMNDAVPGIFNQIDGMSSHSYPNPAFSQPPTLSSKMGIDSFNYERALVRSMNTKDLPVFITETGWSANTLSDIVRADYYKKAFDAAWSDIAIVAVTPFLLKANGEAFGEFSFISEYGEPTEQYKTIKSLPKTRGLPVLSPKHPILLRQQKRVLGLSEKAENIAMVQASSYRDFSKNKEAANKFSLADLVTVGFYWLIRD